jgi:hypothetical protein
MAFVPFMRQAGLCIGALGVNIRICRWWCDRDILAIGQEVRPDRR